MKPKEEGIEIDGLLHGSDYYPEQWQERMDVITRDFQLMDRANINTITIGVFAWSMLEPEEGRFEFGWLDDIFDRMESRKGHVILATPSGARPAWLASKYPEVLRTDENAQRRNYGGRHNHCLTSPIYQEKVRIIDEKLAQRYGKRKSLILWHISNEFSGECHCELCQSAFREWLKKRYKTLDQLNKAWYTNFWSHRYNDWNQIMSPSPLGDIKLNGLNIDWKRFVSQQTLSFYRNEVAIIQKYSEKKPITTNFMAESGYLQPYAGIDYTQLVDDISLVGWDCYPSWHNDQEDDYQVALRVAALDSYFYALKKRPFLIMECTPSQLNWKSFNRPKKPGMHRLSALQLIGDGADGISYFQMRQSLGASEQFHGAIIGHDDSATNRVFQEVAQVGHDYQMLKELQNSYRQAEVAIIYDVENYWALNDAYNFAESTKLYWETIQIHFNSFARQQIPVDIITPDACLDDYKLVIDPMHHMMTRTWLDKINKYVVSGGTIVGTYLTGFVDSSTKAYFGGWPEALKNLYGIQVNETDTLYPKQKNKIEYAGKDYEVYDYCALLKLSHATTLAQYLEDYYRETASITVNRYGAGEAYYIAARTGEAFLTRFYHDICKKNDINMINEAVVPYGVLIQKRITENHTYILIQNFSHSTQKWYLAVNVIDLLSGTEMGIGNHEMEADTVIVLKILKDN
ncbi:beta-galactosidase [Latilactobacillus sakei]|uniref:beta-galactosidase n=1 Tax=Latilactobacillus sakei TaxID=1599 RepID=UPI001389D9A9|nr:beta-galactosidase [Latilactobacillus sakei]MDB1552677.1 beta-galactosidase [Latilactobacillus sakei]